MVTGACNNTVFGLILLAQAWSKMEGFSLQLLDCANEKVQTTNCYSQFNNICGEIRKYGMLVAAD